MIYFWSDVGLKTEKFTIAFLSPTNFEVFENQFLLEYKTLRAKTFTNYSSTSSLNVCIQLMSNIMPSL